MKAQDRNKAAAHAPILELAKALRATGPEQLDELLETRMDDEEQLRAVRAQLGRLYELAGAAFAHVTRLESGEDPDAEQGPGLLELENVQPRPWTVGPSDVTPGLRSVFDAQGVIVFEGVTPEEAALICRRCNEAP